MPPITTNSILADNSIDCDDFPLGFEGQKFAKGNFTQQLKEIDEESTKFDTMEGIDINLELLPYQNSTTPKCPSVSKIPLSPNPIFLANRGFSPTNKESKFAASPLRDISN
nr:hypothetical protein CFP56_68087 [Quercus suber]